MGRRDFAESVKTGGRREQSLLRPKRKAALVATASVFAALYALLGLIPLSKFVLGTGFLTASKVIAPLAGMLFGPVLGGAISLLGNVIAFAFAGQFSSGVVRFDTLAADLAVIATAGFAYTGRRVLALAFPLAVVVLYSIDPLSVIFVGPVPFYWLHLVSFGILGFALILERRKKLGLLHPAFVGAVTLASLMAGQLTGTFVGQNMYVRVYHLYAESTWRSMITFVFAAYPLERVFYAVAGTLVGLPTLRALSRMRKPKVS